MSQQTLNMAVRGLYTFPSEISGVPQGSLQVANNININKLGVAESRRGFTVLSHALPSGTDRLSKLFTFQNQLIGFWGTTLGYYDTSSGWTTFSGSYSAVTGAYLRAAEMSKNLYFNTSTGLKRLSAYNGSVLAAGCPKTLDLVCTDSASSGWLLNTYSVAYRAVIGIRDSNNNLILGAPSQRVSYTNASGSTHSVSVQVYLPDSLTTSHFVQLYRTASISGTPTNEYQLCYEGAITNTDISNKYKTIGDILPDSLLGASLYSNASQEGSSQENYQPPIARDICLFKNYLWFGYPTSKYRFSITLVGVGSPGLQVNDTVTVAGRIYTGKSSENTASQQFKVDTSGTPAQNIDATAQSLCRTINQDTGNSTVYAYYLSDASLAGQAGLPGQILIEERSIGGAVWTFNSSRTGCWSKDLSGGALSASNDTFKNRVMFSKLQQPESVPLLNYIDIGSSNNEIKRLIHLRDSLFIVGSEGVYTIRGNDASSWVADLLDNTARIYATETAQVINNLIYMLCDVGVVSCSETSVGIVSNPIKDVFLNLYGSCPTQVQTYSFAVPYQSEGKYILALPQTSGDSYCTQYYVYDVFTQQWTRWADFSTYCGTVHPADDKLYFGLSSSADTYQERKTLDFTDLYDQGGTKTVTALSGNVMTMTDASGMQAGDTVTQGDNYAYVTAVSETSGEVTIDLSTDLFTTGSVTWQKAIACEIGWNPEFSGNPAGLKHFSECLFMFKRGFVGDVTASFSSDINASVTDVTLEGPTGTGDWGEFDWGDVAWGGDPQKTPVRTLIPRSAARSSQLNVSLTFRAVYNDFQLEGCSLVFNPTGSRIGQ